VGDEDVSTDNPNPKLIEVTRGGYVESVHRGAFAIVNSAGEVVASAGDVMTPIFPRSAVKCLQAIPLIESGAAGRYGLGSRQLALACASHGGEHRHVQAVRSWLRALELSPRDLRCGRHLPYNEAAASRLVATGRRPTPLHNNCSGKHAGCLTTALHGREDLRTYLDPQHPVQRRIAAVLTEMSDCDMARTPCGVDGCGMPVRAMPLRALGLAMARLGARTEREQDACMQLYRAMITHPWLIGGTGRFDTLAMLRSRGRFAVKMGAEGVHIAILPNLKLGIALKIDDGARRAADLAMAYLLHRLGQFDPDLAGITSGGVLPLLSSAGNPVGNLRASDTLRAYASFA